MRPNSLPPLLRSLGALDMIALLSLLHLNLRLEGET